MNKILKISIFWLLASNVFAMQPHNSKVQLKRTAAQQKPPVYQAPLLSKTIFTRQVANDQQLPNTARGITGVVQEPQVIMQSASKSKSAQNLPAVFSETIPEYVGPDIKSLVFPSNQRLNRIRTLKGSESEMGELIADLGLRSTKAIRTTGSGAFSLSRKESLARSVSGLFGKVAELEEAIKANKIELIAKFVSTKTDFFNERSSLGDGCNILMFALRYGDGDTVLDLLEENVFNEQSFGEVDSDGRTPLMYAVNNTTMLNVVLELLGRADYVHKDQVDKKNRNALMYAVCKVGNSEIVSALLRAGARYDHIDDDELSVLDHAVISKNIEVVRILLAGGVSTKNPGMEVRVDFDSSKIERALDIAVKKIAELNIESENTGKIIKDFCSLYEGKSKELNAAFAQCEQMQRGANWKKCNYKVKKFGFNILGNLRSEEVRVGIENEIDAFIGYKIKITNRAPDEDLEILERIIHETHDIVKKQQELRRYKRLYADLRADKKAYEDIIENHLKPELEKFQK